MNTLRISILNHKATKLPKDLADLELIAIEKPSAPGFASILKRLRSENKSVPNMDEITREIELVRTKRYEK